MIAKEKVIETIKSFYTKFRKLSKSKQIAVVLGAILFLFILSKRDDQKSQDSALNNSLTSTNSSGRNQRKADLNLALSNNVLKLPYKIGGFTITKMSAYRYFSVNYPSTDGTSKEVLWKVDIENQTNSEIQGVINICNSNSTAIGNKRLKHAYLADCNPINVRMLPSSIIKDSTFAKSKPWFYRGDTLQICIQGQGCFSNTFSE